MYTGIIYLPVYDDTSSPSKRARAEAIQWQMYFKEETKRFRMKLGEGEDDND